MAKNCCVDVEDCCFTWRIENPLFSDKQTGEYVSSPAFSLDVAGVTRVCLLLYPRGRKAENADYVALYLARFNDEGPCPVVANVSLTMTDAVGTQEKLQESDCQLKRGQGFGTSKFMLSQDLKAYESEILRGKTLTAVCHISPIGDHRKSINPNDDEDIQKLSQDLLTLYDSGIASDLSLAIDGSVFKVHKSVLSARLPLILQNIENKSGENSSEEDIPGIDAPAMQALMNFVYSGTLKNVSAEQSASLSLLADRYEIFDLRRKLLSFQREHCAQTNIRVSTKVVKWSFHKPEGNKKLYTPVIQIADTPCAGIQIILSPVLDDEESFEISICLVASDVLKSFPLVVQINPDRHFYNPKCSNCTKCFFEHVFQTGKGEKEWKIPHLFPKKFFSRSDFNDNYACFILSVPHGQSTLVFEKSTMEVTERQELTQRTNDLNKLGDDLEGLLGNENSYDVQLSVADKTFGAHKAILCARSPTFLNMVANGEMANPLVIPDIEAPIFQNLLRYMYTARIEELDIERAAELYFAGGKFEMLELRKKCSSYLESNFTADNVAAVLVFADEHGDEDLKSTTKDFICAHAKEVLDSSEWKNIMHSRHDLTDELFLYLIMKLPAQERLMSRINWNTSE